MSYQSWIGLKGSTHFEVRCNFGLFISLYNWKSWLPLRRKSIESSWGIWLDRYSGVVAAFIVSLGFSIVCSRDHLKPCHRVFAKGISQKMISNCVNQPNVAHCPIPLNAAESSAPSQRIEKRND
jgi:hypothetical protein